VSLLLLLHAGLLLGGVLALLLMADILRARRPPASSLGWLLFMLTLPWLAAPLYLAVGARKLRKARATKAPALPMPDSAADPADTLERILASAGVPPALPGNRVRFHRDGAEALTRLLTLVGGARHRLDLCLFLMADDAAGRALAEALLAAVGRGARVRLLLDGVGSFLLRRRLVRELTRGGVELAWFTPLLHRPLHGRTNLRNHRKLVIADGSKAWLGGRNAAAEYFSEDRRWTDLSFEIEGPALQRLAQVLAADWAFAAATRVEALGPVPSAGDSVVQVVPSGPDIPGDPLHDLLLTAIYGAQRRITAVTPYFIPDESLQRALCLAARRGVAVALILPQRSNHRLADIARARYLRELHRAGVRVSLVPDAMVHAKALVVDDNLALAGSANLDLRSLFLNFELSCLLRSASDVRDLANWIDMLERRALPLVTQPVGMARSLYEGLVLLLAFQL
jgi:cardiolipin synthase